MWVEKQDNREKGKKAREKGGRERNGRKSECVRRRKKDEEGRRNKIEK